MAYLCASAASAGAARWIAPQPPKRRCASVDSRLIRCHVHRYEPTWRLLPVRSSEPATAAETEGEVRDLWAAIAEKAKRDAPGAFKGFALRAGAVPSTCMGGWISGETALQTLKSPRDTLILFRDTNSWCPFCERVLISLYEKGIPFDSCFINLRNKPEWYEKVAPTQMVPAVKFQDGKVVYESLEILRNIEERFPDAAPLLPAAEDRRAFVEEVIALGEDKDSSFTATGYKCLLGGGFQEPKSEANVPQLLKAFRSALAVLEERLGRYDDGPYFAGSSFSLADISFCPSMYRLSANISAFREYDFRCDPELPRIAAWFQAVSARESVAAVIGDDSTHTLVAEKVFELGKGGRGPVWHSSTGNKDHKLEAAGKLASNWSNVAKKLVSDDSRIDPQQAEFALRLLATHLVDGSSTSSFSLSENVILALQAARELVSAPRDMSGGAAREFRAAASELLQQS